MSRPASESLTTAKRTRTVSSCADSAERTLYSRDHALHTHALHALAHPTSTTAPSVPAPAPASAASASTAPPTSTIAPPPANARKRARVTADHLPPPPPDTSSDAAPVITPDAKRRGPAPVRHHHTHHHRDARERDRPHRHDRTYERARNTPRLRDQHARRRPEPAPPKPPLPAHAALPLHDDAEGHLIYKLGDGLHPAANFPNGRYKILSELGEGTFGKVVECWDRRDARRVAIKVVRSVTKYREAARLEIDVLVNLNLHDPEGFYHCVKLYSCFDYREHVCMVFEKLGPSLYEHLRRNRFRPFPLHQVRDYAFQLLESVNFVHSLTLIHTDLKPENILLVDTKRSNPIKLIDFGSATFDTHHHSAVISTRHYRAPEVILGLGWTYPCDLWSIGCILVELYTGQALFQTHENLEHLAMMSGVLGPIPDSMIRRADGSGQKYFIRVAGGRRALNWPAGASSKASIRSVRRVQSLEDIIRRPDGHAHFFDLVRRLLAFEPDTRCTSAEALRHPFFREVPHEPDLPATTPTLSSGSSACGSAGHNVLPRSQYKGPSRRKPLAQNQSSAARSDARSAPQPAPPLPVQRIDDEGEDTATEMQTAAEHSDHTVVAAPISPHRTATNGDVT